MRRPIDLSAHVPRKNEGRPADQDFAVRLRFTAEEWRIVQAAAGKAGFPVHELGRRLLLESGRS